MSLTALLTVMAARYARQTSTLLLNRRRCLPSANRTWHGNKAVRGWIRQHNQQGKRAQQGMRILPCTLPVKSPWLNPIEPKWVHSKRAIGEPASLLTAQEVADRFCAYVGCSHEPHLSIPDHDP
jgi:hypothetical protein